MELHCIASLPFQTKNQRVFVLRVFLDFSTQAGELTGHPLRTGTKTV